jgi:uncharacterized protein (TIGR02246 family)
MDMSNTNTSYQDKLAVLKLHDEVLESFNRLDVEKLLSLHSENIILMEPNMPAIKGKEEIRKLANEFKEQKIVLKLSYNIEEAEVFGNRAFVRGRVMKTTIQDNDRITHDAGKFITLSQKQDDCSWLRTHVIVNSDMPAAKQSSSLAPIPEEVRENPSNN